MTAALVFELDLLPPAKDLQLATQMEVVLLQKAMSFRHAIQLVVVEMLPVAKDLHPATQIQVTPFGPFQKAVQWKDKMDATQMAAVKIVMLELNHLVAKDLQLSAKHLQLSIQMEEVLRQMANPFQDAIQSVVLLAANMRMQQLLATDRLFSIPWEGGPSQKAIPFLPAN